MFALLETHEITAALLRPNEGRELVALLALDLEHERAELIVVEVERDSGTLRRVRSDASDRRGRGAELTGFVMHSAVRRSIALATAAKGGRHGA